MALIGNKTRIDRALTRRNKSAQGPPCACASARTISLVQHSAPVICKCIQRMNIFINVSTGSVILTVYLTLFAHIFELLINIVYFNWAVGTMTFLLKYTDDWVKLL